MMTVEQARRALGAMVGVIPTDAFPAGQWTGERRRTLHNDEAIALAVPAQVIGVDTALDPQTGKRTTVAAVAYAAPATGTDYFRPGAIVGRWAEVEQIRREQATELEREPRALRVARALGNEVRGERDAGGRWLVVMTVEAAERTVRLASLAADYLDRGEFDDARRIVGELIDYALHERDLERIIDDAERASCLS